MTTLLNSVAPLMADVDSSSPRRVASISSTHLGASKALSMFQNDDGGQNDTSAVDEFEVYESLNDRTFDGDILKWWHGKKRILPRITKLACFLFAIPASSASCERCFSTAGYTVKNKPNLCASTLDNLLVLKSNDDLML